MDLPDKNKPLRTILWKDGRVELIDQNKLPSRLEWIKCKTFEDIADAIKRKDK